MDILGGLRSACTYVGASSLKEVSKRTTFIRVTQQVNTVFNSLRDESKLPASYFQNNSTSSSSSNNVVNATLNNNNSNHPPPTNNNNNNKKMKM